MRKISREFNTTILFSTSDYWLLFNFKLCIFFHWLLIIFLNIQGQRSVLARLCYRIWMLGFNRQLASLTNNRSGLSRCIRCAVHSPVHGWTDYIFVTCTILFKDMIVELTIVPSETLMHLMADWIPTWGIFGSWRSKIVLFERITAILTTVQTITLRRSHNHYTCV